MTTRKQIRDEVACIVRSTAPTLKLFVGDFFAIANDELPMSAIYFDTGQVEQQGLASSLIMNAVLDVDFFSIIGDDELDCLADPVIEAILNSPELRSMALRVGYGGFQYLRDQGQGFAALKASFEFVYKM